MGEHAGLARAGAGQDQQRPLAVLDRLALGRVQLREQALDLASLRGRRVADLSPTSPTENSRASGAPMPTRGSTF